MLELERNLVRMTIYKHSGMRAMDGNRTGHVCEQEGHENINIELSKLTDEGVRIALGCLSAPKDSEEKKKVTRRNE